MENLQKIVVNNAQDLKTLSFNVLISDLNLEDSSENIINLSS